MGEMELLMALLTLLLLLKHPLVQYFNAEKVNNLALTHFSLCELTKYQPSPC